MLKLRNILLSSKAAIDLASIMVGIIVIGLIGGVIAATVFAVIPWAQDSVAKQQLESIHTAQNAAFGLSADPSRELPAGQERNSFTNSEGLAGQGLLTQGESYCTTAVGENKKDYRAYVKSSAGKIWFASNNAKQAKILIEGTPGLEDCSGWVEENSGFEDNPSVPTNPELPDEEPTRVIYADTRFTINCPAVVTNLFLPIAEADGKVVITRLSDGVVIHDGTATSAATAYRASGTYAKDVAYEIVFTGTFGKLVNTTDTKSLACYREMTAWGTDSGTHTVDGGFKGMTNLIKVPESIPETVTVINSMFSLVAGFNQDISNWDVSNVTTMTNMFYGAAEFNQDISSWDTSKVVTMSNMFAYARKFNQNISGWNVDKVTAKTNFRLNSALTDENTPVKLR